MKKQVGLTIAFYDQENARAVLLADMTKPGANDSRKNLIWKIEHPHFRLTRQIRLGHAFTSEVWWIDADQQTTLLLELDKPLVMLLHVLTGTLLLPGCLKNGGPLLKKQSLLNGRIAGHYQIRVPSGRHHYFCSYLPEKAFKRLSKTEFFSRSLPALLPLNSPIFSSRQFQRLIARLLHQNQKDRSPPALERYNLDKRLWALFCCGLHSLENPIHQPSTRQIVYQIKNDLDQLAENQQTFPGVTELADTYSVHPQNLTRVFKAEFGITLRDYTTNLKMETGYRLLQEQKFSVQMVAFQLGYQDPYSFSRQFRIHFGFSPGKLLKSAPDNGTEM